MNPKALFTLILVARWCRSADEVEKAVAFADTLWPRLVELGVVDAAPRAATLVEAPPHSDKAQETRRDGLPPLAGAAGRPPAQGHPAYRDAKAKEEKPVEQQLREARCDVRQWRENLSRNPEDETMQHILEKAERKLEELLAFAMQGAA